MKALILNLCENSVNGLQKNSSSEVLSHLLFARGVEICANLSILPEQNYINDAINLFHNDVNLVIVLSDTNPQKNLQIKEAISTFLKDSLEINVFAEEFVKNYYKLKNLPLEQTSLEEAKIPSSSKPIENIVSYLQGFVTFYNGKHIVFLPNDTNSIKHLFNEWFVDYLESKFSKLSLIKIIKTFGITKKEALKLLDDLLKNKNQIKITINEDDLELFITIKYSPLTPKEDILAYLKNVVERLKGFIYTAEDKSLYEVAYEKLKEYNIQLAVAESITGGSIVSNLIKNNEGISEYLLEGIVAYTNEAKMNRLKVSYETLQKYSSVSSETAYEMAAGLLETNEHAQFVLATTGYASGQDSKNGLVYIAVGSMEGIHIYQNKFTGSREKIIDQATKTTLFYFIKKLNQNRINIEQMFDNY